MLRTPIATVVKNIDFGIPLLIYANQDYDFPAEKLQALGDERSREKWSSFYRMKHPHSALGVLRPSVTNGHSINNIQYLK